MYTNASYKKYLFYPEQFKNDPSFDRVGRVRRLVRAASPTRRSNWH
ncbi:hypothetical protein [Nostoc sp. NMS4]|nr:hypothetical protein [Nostoc sp. NMS4]MBN3922788.1 hypothetical protein [Nostoc sp. NMS4]